MTPLATISLCDTATIVLTDAAGCRHGIESLHLYTDGSSSEKGASWAAIVLARSIIGTYFRVCHFGGLVQTQPDHWSYLGAAALNSFTAEVSGIAWASLWLLQWPAGCHVFYHYDNLSAAHCSTGEWSAASHKLLVNTSHVLTRMVMRRHRAEFCHVKGHSSHPWNELVDRLAAAALAGTLEQRVSLPALRQLVACTPHELMIASEANDCLYASAQYPSACGSVLVPGQYCHPHLEHSSSASAGYDGWQKRAARGFTEEFDLTFSQFNVQSLGMCGEHADSSSPDVEQARSLYLDRLFREARVTFGGKQETRTHGPGIREQLNYLVAIGGAARTGKAIHFGCEMWIAKTIASVGGREVSVDRSCIAIVHSEPRKLLVTLRVGPLQLNFCVFHAPHKRCHPTPSVARKMISDYWDECCGLVATHFQEDITLVVLADVNGSIGATTSRGIGSHHALATEDIGGHGFRRFTDACSLVVPATFSSAHAGDSHTWEHHSGTRHRTSYVAISAHLLGGSRSWVDHNMDVAITSKDHSPAFVTTRITCAAADHLYHRRKPIISRVLLKDPARIAAFTADLAYAPVPDWHVNGHDHHKIVFDYLQDLGAYHFAPDTSLPRKSWISKATFEIIKNRCPFKAHLHYAAALAKDLVRHVAFYAWLEASRLGIVCGSFHGQCKRGAYRGRCLRPITTSREICRTVLDTAYVGISYAGNCALIEYGGQPTHCMMKSCNTSYSVASVKLSRSLVEVKQAIKADKVVYYESLGVEVQAAMENGNLRAAFKTFRQMMPGKNTCVRCSGYRWQSRLHSFTYP